MEKDSFEKLLRGKVLQAESALSQNSDKEKVWNTIQKKQQPKRKLYYAAAVILLIASVVGLLYVKKDETITTVTKAKKEKTDITNFPKPQVIEQVRLKQAEATSRIANQNPSLIKIKQDKSMVPTANPVAHKQGHSIAISPVADEVVAVIVKEASTENKTTPVATVSTVPEFTVQFKRGADIVNNADEGLIITTLKKFKLKRDTTYFANAVEKQSTKIKISFKKEN